MKIVFINSLNETTSFETNTDTLEIRNLEGETMDGEPINLLEFKIDNTKTSKLKVFLELTNYK